MIKYLNVLGLCKFIHELKSNSFNNIITFLENAKMLLAKAGVCELLLKLLEKHSPQCNDEETRSILKVACNLIVLILTGGES